MGIQKPIEMKRERNQIIRNSIEVIKWGIKKRARLSHA